MGIFRSKGSENSLIGNAVKNEVEGLYNTSVMPVSSVSDTVRDYIEGVPLAPSNPISAAIENVVGKPVTDGEITYSANSSGFFVSNAIRKGNAGTNMPSPDKSQAPLDYWDIAQSHFFTVEIKDKLVDVNGKPFQFASGKGTYQNYIPLKSMNFNFTTYENMNVPFGIFGDLPLLHKKKVTTISFSCYDIDQDSIELALRRWEESCFPQATYVAFLEDVAAELKYVSYDVKGKRNFERVLYVIPASTVSVNRSYEENGPKLLNFSVVAVGAVGASATAALDGADKGGDGRFNVVKQNVYGFPFEYHTTDNTESDAYKYTDNTGREY